MTEGEWQSGVECEVDEHREARINYVKIWIRLALQI